MFHKLGDKDALGPNVLTKCELSWAACLKNTNKNNDDWYSNMLDNVGLVEAWY